MTRSFSKKTGLPDHGAQGAASRKWRLPALAMAAGDESVVCPNCNAVVKKGDIICISCGTNLLTGQQVLPDMKRESPAGPALGKMLSYGALGVLALALVGGFVFLLMYILRDPVAEARNLARGGNVLEALNVLQSHLEDRPEDDQGQYLLGQLQWRSEQFAASATAFEAAARLEPSNADAGLFAAAAYGRVSGDAAKTSQLGALQLVLEHHPDHQEARYLLALAEGASDDLAQFKILAEEASRTAQSGDGLQLQALAEALNGDIAQAYAHIRDAYQVAGDADTLAALGAIAFLEGDREEAKTQLQSALGQGSSVTPLLQAQLGLILLAEGDSEGALRLLREAVESPMTPSHIRFYYGLALQALGLTTEALVQYERVVSGSLPQAAEASAQMALIFLQQDNLQKAEEILRTATQSGTVSAKVHTLQGQLYAQQGNIPEAQQSLRRAVQLDDTYAPARLENGLLFVTRGMLEDGLRELEVYMRLAEERGVPNAEIEVLVNQLRQTLETSDRASLKTNALWEPRVS